MTQPKNFQRMMQVALTAALVTITAACAPGFETAATKASGALNNGSSGTGGGTDNTDNSANWNAISMDGSINGGRFDKTRVVEIDRAAKALVVRLPFIAGIQIGAQIPVAIREIPGATVGIEPQADGTSAIVLRIPLEKVLHGVDTLPAGRLPNGDALPAIPEGELPSIGLTFNSSGSVKGALYLSPTVVGIFVATKFDPYIRLTLPIRNEARTQTYGYFTSIPAKTGFDGGFFLSVALPDDLSRAIDDLL